MHLAAIQDRLTPIGVFQHAPPVAKLIVLCLLASMLAALIVCAVKLATGPRLSGGSAYLSGLRLGGPIMGLLGAAWTGLGISMGLANADPAPLNTLALGFSEALLLVVMGFLAGAVAVITTWAVESHIDRSVLKA